MRFSQMGPQIVYPGDTMFAGVETSLKACFQHWMKCVNVGLYSYSTVIVSFFFFFFDFLA